MRELLSSRWTLGLKIVFPALWLVAFGGASLMIWVGRGDLELGFVFTAVTVMGLLVCARTLLPLKRVVAQPDGLRVSNFVRETLIAYDDISSVREWFWNPRTVEVRFRGATAFGNRILFLPFSPFLPRWSKDHMATTFLKKKAGLDTQNPALSPKQRQRI